MIVSRCVGCDSIRDTERAFCSNCNEATDSYPHDLNEREQYAYERMTVLEKARKFTPVVDFQRSPCGFIHIPGWDA